jgi:hypothetical protein
VRWEDTHENFAFNKWWAPPSFLQNEYWGLFPVAKAAGREADHSPPSSAEVKNAWSYTSTPPIRLHDVLLD